ncbi:hypothetical protein [Paenibacillus sp. XY044]|uniref:hypothetical protein n=1 Tax=Paenibacillus sp. XY044 TaxID=2026089 RepID=UPI000B98ACF0|nr:hypothetical protein [Paenibacillus sp. XY044]OZB98800.1 hypothetical protein CJP46_06595 [Paenibacillus sp. XY044]
MKKSSLLTGIVIGSVSVLLLVLLIKLSLFIGHDAPGRNVHGFVKQGHQVYPGFSRPGERMEAEMSPVWTALLQITLMIGGMLLFLKSKGGLKWAGVILAALGTLSLFTPLWGAIILIAAFLLYRRINSQRKSPISQAYSVPPLPHELSSGRGQFLDEWERRQHKED